MTNTEYLASIPDACIGGREWVQRNGITSDAEAWARLDRVDWMLWLIETRGINLDESRLRLAACDFAERALHIFEAAHPGDQRPRQVIETARRYARGEATRRELDAAGDAAWAAAVAAGDAARDAAWAAAVDAAVAAGDAAWDAAVDAGDAAVDAGDAARDAAVDAAVAARAAAWDAAVDAGDAAWAAARAALDAADAGYLAQSNILRTYFPNPFEEAPND